MEIKEVKDLKRGDLIMLRSGLPAEVKSCERNPLFDGFAYEVETDMGSDIVDGHDKVEVVD